MPVIRGLRVRHPTYGEGVILRAGIQYRTVIVRFDWMRKGFGKTIRLCTLKRIEGANDGIIYDRDNGK